jgi:hypothetical protein
MKNKQLITSKQLRDIADSIKDIADRIEGNNYQCVQIADVNKKQQATKKYFNVDINIKLRIFRQEYIDEINKYLGDD